VSDTAKDWLTRKEASLYLYSLGCPISVSTLANMAGKDNAGDGPPFSRVSWRIVRYLRRDIDAWVRRKVQRVT